METVEDKKKREEEEEEEKKRQDEEFEAKYGDGSAKAKPENASPTGDRKYKVSPSEGETDNDDMIKEIYSPEKIKPGTENHFGVDIDDVAHTHHRSIKGFFNEILPEEFDEGKWFDLYLHRLLLEHSWLCIFAPYKKGRDRRSTKFAISMCNLIAFLFTTTILAVLFFRDDGHCEDISQEDTCNAQKSAGSVRTICNYNIENDFCMFVSPLTDFYTILVFAVVATTLAVPLRMSMEYMINKIFKRYPENEGRKKKRNKKAEVKGVVPVTNQAEDGKHYHDQDLDKTIEDVIHAEDWEHHLESQVKTDEFREVQTVPATLMRAARLEKAQKSMDYVLPVEETALVMLQADADTQRFKNHMIFKNRVDTFSFRIMRYGFTRPKTKEIMRKLLYAREHADFVKSELELMDTDEEREVYLMKTFIVDYFQGYHRAIAHRYMLGSFESVKHSYFRALRKTLFMLLLPAMVLMQVYLIYQYHFSLGSRTTNLWLYITLLAFLQEIFLLQPLKILVRWVCINNVVAGDIRRMVLDFRDRCRIILIRKSGVMRDSNALVQHFNPACRAARMFPELPVSRVLMTVSDFDVPIVPQRSLLMHLQGVFWTIVMSAVLLPVTLQDPLLEILYNLIINGVMLGLYLYSTMNLAVTIVLLVVVFGMVASRESIIRFFERQAAERKRRKENENMFYEVEQENILDLAAFSDEKKRKAKREGKEFDDESKDGSVYLNELDMVSPDVTKIKPGSPRGGEDGYEADTTPVPVRKGRGEAALQGIDEGDDLNDDPNATLSPFTSRSRISTEHKKPSHSGARRPFTPWMVWVPTSWAQ